MARSTVQWLAERGLGLDDLDEAFLDAVQDIDRVLYPPGGNGLTEPERQVLRAGGLDPDETEPLGARDPAALYVADHAALLTQALTVKEAAARLGVTEARVRQRIDDGSLWARRFGNRWALPAFQFGPTGELPGWIDVCRALPRDLPLTSVWRWLTLPNPDLEVGDAVVSPLDWLRAGGDPAEVVDLAGRIE